jgi:acyl carrier protein
MNNIEQRVIKLISEQLCVEETVVLLTASLEKDLDADSLDSIELTMALEEEFDIEISDQIAETLHTVGNIVDLVKKLTDQ